MNFMKKCHFLPKKCIFLEKMRVSDQNNKCPPSEKEHEKCLEKCIFRKSYLHGIQPKHTILLQRGPGERAGQAGVHPAALALGPGGDGHRQAGPHTRYVAYSNLTLYFSV